MPNDNQETLARLWDRYRLALQRLDWALDELDKYKPKPVVAPADPLEISEDEATDPNIAVQRGLDRVVRFKNKNYSWDAFKGLHPSEPIYSVKIQADNEVLVTNQCGFGDKFPLNPAKGDMFIRTDYLPSRLYKWNEKKWIELDKSTTDTYSYNEAYIHHLINKLNSGEYDLDDLSEAELNQIEEYNKRHGTD